MKTKLVLAISSVLALGACNDDSVVASAGNFMSTVAIAGDAIVGETIASVITDGNGVESANVTYTWMANGDVISGASSSTYLITSTDEGSRISLSVSYVDNDGYDEKAISSATEVVEIPSVPSIGSVVIAGDAYVGFELTAEISDENGFGNTPVDYVWMADGVAIPGADSASYMLTADELNKTITVMATYIDNDDYAEDVISSPTAAVIEKPADVVTTKVASITDNMTDDAGELRYKHSATIEAGKLSVSFAKDEVMTAEGSAKEAYIALYGSSTSTSKAMVDLRIGNGTFTIRDQADITVAATFTPGDWVDVEMTWDTSNASASTAPLVTVSINGSAVTVSAFPSASTELESVMDGVRTIVFKLSDTSSVVTGAYLVDDIKLYSDISGTTLAFEDDFEGYNVADSLDNDNANSPYDSSTAEAVVAEVIKEGTQEPVEPVEPEIMRGNFAAITDNMTDDAGELRYKHDTSIEAGKLNVSFAKDEVMTAEGSAKEAYIALYGSSTSTSKAMVDLRIGNGTFTIRDQGDIAVAATFTPGDWIDVEMTWDASNASATVAPLVTISINGTSVTVAAFSSVSTELESVMDGVKTVVFKVSDTSSVVTGAYMVDNIKLYADLAGTMLAFEDDFESYAVGDSLDNDNANSPYDSSTAEAVVAN